MNLTKTRAALALAEDEFAALASVENDPAAFRHLFPLTAAAILRVGSILNQETAGSRTPSFGDWWRQTEQDPRYAFLRGIRNAEFKRAEETKHAHVFRTLHEVLGVGIEGGYEMRNVQTGEVQNGAIKDDPDVHPKLAPAVPPDSGSTRWTFDENGEEVLPLLHRYLVWLRDEIIPTAERLTT